MHTRNNQNTLNIISHNKKNSNVRGEKFAILFFYSANMMALRKKRAVGLSPTALSDYSHLTIQNNY